MSIAISMPVEYPTTTSAYGQIRPTYDNVRSYDSWSSPTPQTESVTNSSESFLQSTTGTNNISTSNNQQLDSSQKQILKTKHHHKIPKKMSIEQATPSYEEAIRWHFVNPILLHLSLSSQSVFVPTLSFGGKLLSLLSEAMIGIQADMYLRILTTLFHSLAFEDNWKKLSPDKLKEIHDILRSYAKQKEIDRQMATHAISAFKKIGLNPTPFAIPSPAQE